MYLTIYRKLQRVSYALNENRGLGYLIQLYSQIKVISNLVLAKKTNPRSFHIYILCRHKLNSIGTFVVQKYNNNFEILRIYLNVCTVVPRHSFTSDLFIIYNIGIFIA